MKEKTPIEFNPELAPVLKTLAQKVNADLALLYEYVDVKDVEITELLDLICNSPLFINEKGELNKKEIKKIFINEMKCGNSDIKKNKKFFTTRYKYDRSIICFVKRNEKGINLLKRCQKGIIYKFGDNKKGKRYVTYNLPTIYDRSIFKLLKRYQKGILYEFEGDKENKECYDYIIDEDLKFIKENVRILRLSEYVETEPGKHKYEYDYTDRPPKYLVFKNDILKDSYHNAQIKQEGLTSYFMRTKEKAELNDNCTGGIKKCIQLGKRYATNILEDVFIKSKKPPLGQINIAAYLLLQSEIDLNEAHSKRTSNNTYTIYGHHAAWVLLSSYSNDKSEKPIERCIRFEYHESLACKNKYNDKYTDKIRSKSIEIDQKQENKRGRIEEIKSTFTSETIPILCDIINSVLENHKIQSYNSNYDCLDPILKQLVQIELVLNKERNKNKNNEDFERRIKIHNLVKHLFCVFKRDTYYGDLIYDRVNKFITALLELLDLPSDAFTEIWDSLKKQEELMLYDLKNYRDHFMHQFHVFVTGYIFIYKYGIKDLTNMVNESYSQNSRKDQESHSIGDSEQDKSNSGTEFKELDILRIWAFTSLYHDCGYSFEHLSKGFESFTDNIMHVKLDADFKWCKFFLENQDIIKGLQQIAGKFNYCKLLDYENDENNHKREKQFGSNDIFRILLQKGIQKNDHGVMSALILLQQFRSAPKKNSINKYSYSDVHLINKIVNIAAISIAVHNNVYPDIRSQLNQRICLKQNPFAFILAFCDTVQEWGRKDSNKEKSIYVSPELDEIQYKDKDDDQGITLQSGNKKENEKEYRNFQIKLKYNPKKEKILPTQEFILEKISNISKSFLTTHYFNIDINYNIANEDIFKFSFVNCTEKCKRVCNRKPDLEKQKKEENKDKPCSENKQSTFEKNPPKGESIEPDKTEDKTLKKSGQKGKS